MTEEQEKRAFKKFYVLTIISDEPPCSLSLFLRLLLHFDFTGGNKYPARTVSET